MGLKVKIKLALTITASVLAVGHLFFPKISIDLITVSLLAIAVVPWLDILFKSVELPGGVKLEFHELEKISNEAERIGLIKPEVASDGDENLVTKVGYYFVEMARSNQELALVSLRIEIEKRLRDIAAKYNIDGRGYSLSRLMDIFAGRHILSTEEIAVLKDMVATLNQASHGVQFDERNADWIIDKGPAILESLESKVSHRGIIFHGTGENQEHWIDKSFQDCKWETNFEWSNCIAKHSDLWEKELKNVLQSLLERVSADQKSILSESQTNWERQIQLDKDFLFSFSDLQYKVGREGQMLSYIHFMNKIRARTLELEEILNSLT